MKCEMEQDHDILDYQYPGVHTMDLSSRLLRIHPAVRLFMKYLKVR
jgi:hypothetical protein